MRKKFNDTGLCVPDRHYMADISEKLDRIVRLIEDGQYFAINRPRQFGKTTILFLLAKRLFSEGEYLPVEISFEGFGDETYRDQKLFFEALRFSIDHFFQIHGLDDLSRFMEKHGPVETFVHLGRFISDLCKQAGKPVVLMIDEVDKSSGKQLFRDFLGLLRAKLCKFIDEKITASREDKNWSAADAEAAFRMISHGAYSTSLFDSLGKELENHPELYELVFQIAINGKRHPFSIADPVTNLGHLFGILAPSEDGDCRVHNRIFEQRIYDHMMSKFMRKKGSEKKAITFPQLDRITINPDVMGGKPCIRGLRVTVGAITGLLASGASFQDILDLYPYLKEEDIKAALAYATWRMEEYDIALGEA